ncbi:MAG TPA: Ig-like domain-containing protein, partial [Bacteroidia bacterium]|nr:Ig-like domain-containing protein [Bacteroidia bacterium]
NCQNETLYNDFIYGSEQGINLNSDGGSAPTGVSLGLGIDGTRNSMNFNAIGAAGFDFINTQTVALTDSGNRYITTTPTFASQNTTLFNSDYWGNPPNGIILNGGTLNFQAANFNQPGQANWGNLTSGSLNLFGSAVWPVNATLNAGGEPLLTARSSIIDSSNIIRPNTAAWIDNLGNPWMVNVLKAMPRTGWSATASVNSAGAQNALDSNETTRWSTNGVQAPGQSYTVDMKNLKQFYEIALENANGAGDYPAGYAVYVSTDGVNWGSPVATGVGSSGLTIITFPTQIARYIKVVQTGSTTGNYWSIYEFYVFGVNYVAATGVTVSPATATINVGGTQKLTATLTPANASDTAVTWVSSDPTKATVDSTGLVTGVAVGSVTITVTTQDGSKTATSTITITGSESPYGGTPWPIPGTIQSENYDNGGQGIAYNDSDP